MVFGFQLTRKHPPREVKQIHDTSETRETRRSSASQHMTLFVQISGKM